MSALKAFTLVLLALLMGLSSGLDLLFSLAYTILGVMVVSLVWSWMNIGWLGVQRECRVHRSQVGEAIEERLLVHNWSILPKLWVELRDHSTLPGHNPSRVVTLPGGGSRTWRVKTICQRRGRFTLGPLTLLSGDPFGLFEMRRRLRDTSSLLVYPTTIELPELNLPLGELPGGSLIRRRAYHVTPNVSTVRDYAPGDSLSRIHWPSTARTRRLMVKEFELDPISDVWIILDLEQRVQAGEGQESTEEYGVTAAASLAKHFLALNRAVGLVAYGEQPSLIPADRGSRQLLKILEELAVVKAAGCVPLAEIFLAESSRFNRNTTVVVVTPSLEESWAHSLQSLGQHGIRCAVVAMEPSTFGGPEGSLMLVGSLAAMEIPAFLVKKGDRLDKVLAGTGSMGGRWMQPHRWMPPAPSASPGRGGAG